MNKTRGWGIGFILSLIFWGILFLVFYGCGKNVKKSLTKENYLLCSHQSYQKMCTGLVVGRRLYPYELYSQYCVQDYLICLKGF